MERWQRIDSAASDEARELLRACCAARRWIDRMLARRPFGSAARVLAAARDEWFALSPVEWRDAFAHHPPIGDVETLKKKFVATRTLSAREQAGVDGAPPELLDALLAANRQYEARFGYIFIVCATGKTAAEMLDLLNARLGNSPDVEILIAAEEHAKICALRLTGETENSEVRTQNSDTF